MFVSDFFPLPVRITSELGLDTKLWFGQDVLD